MKNQQPPTQNISGSLFSLQELVSNLVNSFLPAAKRNHTLVVNEVRQEIALGTSAEKVAAIIRELLNAMVGNSNYGEIHITAERYKNTVTLQLQERNNNNGYALAYSVDTIKPEANSAGGHISINDPQKKVATICFSFPDQQAA